jgi:hypothetical protein
MKIENIHSQEHKLHKPSIVEEEATDSCYLYDWICSFFSFLGELFATIFCLKCDSPEQNSLQNRNITLQDLFISSKPIGIYRKGNNCCINVIAQLVIHNKSLRNAFSNDPNWRAFIDAYALSLKTRNPVDARYCVALRESMREVVDPRRQTDSGNLLRNFADKNKYVNFTSALLPQNSHAETRFLESIYLPLCSKHDYSLPDLIDCELTVSNNNKWKKREITDAPEDLILWHSDKVTPTLVKGGHPLTLELSEHYFANNKPARYECDFIVLHQGTEDSGHYVCVRKVNGSWYWINDHESFSIKHDTLTSVEELLASAGQNNWTCQGLNYKRVD